MWNPNQVLCFVFFLFATHSDAIGQRMGAGIARGSQDRAIASSEQDRDIFRGGTEDAGPNSGLFAIGSTSRAGAAQPKKPGDNNGPTPDEIRKQGWKEPRLAKRPKSDLDAFGFLNYWGSRFIVSNFEYVGLSFFEPKARVYFDTGNDDPGELDAFNNGGLVVVVEVASVNFRNRLGSSESNWFWGPNLGVGIAASSEFIDKTKKNDDGTRVRNTSNAPTVFLDAGITLEYLLDFSSDRSNPSPTSSFGLEAGFTYAISADEDISNNDDTGFFIGFVFSQAW